MYRRPLAPLAFLVALVAPTAAWAHVSIGSGPAFADTTGEVTFSVGHGCEGSDTYRVEVEIPSGVTSVRPETSDFGDVNVMTDDAGTIVMVSWHKPEASVLPKDTQFYKLLVRLKPPAAPFTTLHFPAHQTCKAEDGTSTVVDWVGLDEEEGSDVEPAPVLHILPPRFPGWNKFAVPARVDDLAGFFPEAQIVWLDNAAFSVNPTTVELIGQTEGVTLLDAIPARSEIWVRY
jgi:periplasmic copper chaperone A